MQRTTVKRNKSGDREGGKRSKQGQRGRGTGGSDRSDRTVKCPLCGRTVKKSLMRQHFAEQHPDRGESKQRRGPRRSPNQQTMPTGQDDASSRGRCLYCGQLVSREHLAEHVREEHSDVAAMPDDEPEAESPTPQQPQVPLEPCSECGANIRRDRMARHLAKVHGIRAEGSAPQEPRGSGRSSNGKEDPWPGGLPTDPDKVAEKPAPTRQPAPPARVAFKIDGDVLLIREMRRGRGNRRRPRITAVVPQEQWPELMELLSTLPPAQPDQPEQPEQPKEAKQPDQPQLEQPVEPDQPEQPEQPKEAEQPEQLQLEQPVEPDQPEQLEQPKEAEQPEQPVEPEQPKQPKQPVKKA